MDQNGIVKSCLAVSLALAILALFSLIYGTPGSAPYTLALLTLIINVVFSGALLGKKLYEYFKNRKNKKPRA